MTPKLWTFIYVDTMTTGVRYTIPLEAEPAEFLFHLKESGIIDRRSRYYLVRRSNGDRFVIHKASNKTLGFLTQVTEMLPPR